MLAAGILLVALLLAAYHNSFRVPYILDDADAITQNTTIRSLGTALFPPSDSGITVSGRPLLNFTLAINYALGGKDEFGYHVGNLLIHALAALMLFGVIRRTLGLPLLASRFGPHRTALAWFAAALWALHPMQTESVTYIIQRAESLVGLCYLLTVYAFIRSIEGTSRLWPALTVIACYLGMSAKEVMASAPLVIFLYDRTFASGTFRESWQRHGKLHLALASGWLLLGALVISSGGRGNTVGYAVVSWWDYVLTQGPGVATYLFHAVWPANLVFDYGAIVEKRPSVVISGLTVVLILLVTVAYLLRKRPAWGFIGAWLFLILAPTSSVIPVATQTLAEHRMYLPLATVTTTIVVGAFLLRTWLRWSVLSLLVVTAAVLTVDRNSDYASGLSIWEDTVRKVPDNVRALNNLSLAYLEEERADDAIRCLREALELVPNYAVASANLGQALVKKALRQPTQTKTDDYVDRTELSAPAGSGGSNVTDAQMVEEGIGFLERALELDPGNAYFHALFGNALFQAGRSDRAIAMFEHAVALDPENVDYHYDLANVLARLDRPAEAEKHYLLAVQKAPEDVGVLTNYGSMLRQVGRLPESLVYLQRALERMPTSARVKSNYGVSLVASGRMDEGIRELSEALRLNPELPQARYHLSNAFAETGRPQEAIVHAEALLKLAPPTAEILSNLAVLYARVGRFEDAVSTTRRALELDPSYEPALENLEKLSAFLRASGGVR